MALGLSLRLDSDLGLGFALAAIDTVFAMAADGMKFVLAAAGSLETWASVLVLAVVLSYSARRIGSDLSFDSALD